MDHKRMTFDIDRRCVTEGEVVEITWQCEGADSVLLTIDNGFRSTDIPLEISGSKRFRLNRSKGKTHLILTVKLMGKEYQKKIDVRVKKMPAVKAETVDSNGRRTGFLQQWCQKMRDNTHNLRAKTRLALHSLPERKQLAVKVLTMIGIMLILCAVWPNMAATFLAIVAVYLIIVLMRR